MDNTISHFQVDGLEIKLTEDKLFINTAASNEAFALRSVDGIGVIDLVQNYNTAINNVKELKNQSTIYTITGVVIALFSLWIFKLDNSTIALIILFFGVAFTGFGIWLRSGLVQPTLKSAVRIMMSGGNRDFIFDKADANSNNVAEFVAKVENTLTAFHKKNA
jgi:hypothetical protein